MGAGGAGDETPAEAALKRRLTAIEARGLSSRWPKAEGLKVRFSLLCNSQPTAYDPALLCGEGGSDTHTRSLLHSASTIVPGTYTASYSEDDAEAKDGDDDESVDGNNNQGPHVHNLAHPVAKLVCSIYQVHLARLARSFPAPSPPSRCRMTLKPCGMPVTVSWSSSSMWHPTVSTFSVAARSPPSVRVTAAAAAASVTLTLHALYHSCSSHSGRCCTRNWGPCGSRQIHAEGQGLCRDEGYQGALCSWWQELGMTTH